MPLQLRRAAESALLACLAQQVKHLVISLGDSKAHLVKEGLEAIDAFASDERHRGKMDVVVAVKRPFDPFAPAAHVIAKDDSGLGKLCRNAAPRP